MVLVALWTWVSLYKKPCFWPWLTVSRHVAGILGAAGGQGKANGAGGALDLGEVSLLMATGRHD